jgi:hypothetical protein
MATAALGAQEFPVLWVLKNNFSMAEKLVFCTVDPGGASENTVTK